MSRFDVEAQKIVYVTEWEREFAGEEDRKGKGKDEGKEERTEEFLGKIIIIMRNHENKELRKIH